MKKYKINNIIILILPILLIFSSCSTTNKKNINQTSEGFRIQEKLVESYPDTKPDWLINVPQKENDNLVFIGISDKFRSEKDACENALKNAVQKFAAYCGVEIEDLARTIKTGYNLSSEITDATKSEISATKQIVNAYVSRMKAGNWYIEKYEKFDDKKYREIFYIAYVKANIPEEEFGAVKLWKEKKELEEKQRFANYPLEIMFSFISEDRVGNITVLRNMDNVYSGKTFNIMVRPNQDCYFYVFNIDTSKKVNMIFPKDNVLDINNPLQKNVEYKIPENLVYAFDDVKGKEIFYIFGFKKEQQDINFLIQRIKNDLSYMSFESEITQNFNIRGTVVKKKNNSFKPVDKSSFFTSEIVTGKDYIMRVMEFKHY
jgi:hypothetical protein